MSFRGSDECAYFSHFNKVIFRSAEHDIDRRLCSVSTHFVCSFVRMHAHIYEYFQARTADVRTNPFPRGALYSHLSDLHLPGCLTL